MTEIVNVLVIWCVEKITVGMPSSHGKLIVVSDQLRPPPQEDRHREQAQQDDHQSPPPGDLLSPQHQQTTTGRGETGAILQQQPGQVTPSPPSDHRTPADPRAGRDSTRETLRGTAGKFHHDRTTGTGRTSPTRTPARSPGREPTPPDRSRRHRPSRETGLRWSYRWSPASFTPST